MGFERSNNPLRQRMEDTLLALRQRTEDYVRGTFATAVKYLDGTLPSGDSVMREIFTSIIGSQFERWFERQEATISRDPRAHESDTSYTEGTADASKTVLYLSGMFDDDSKDRMERIYGARTSERDEYWTCFDALYSIRDSEQVQRIMEEVEAMVRQRLEQEGTVTLSGYSCGGLMAKVVADRLSEEYPGRIGVVAHNAPLDADQGFFVRHANFQAHHERMGFTPTCDGAYPLIVLQGTDDMIVPANSSARSSTGEEIKSKAIPFGHKEPLCSPEAARRIYAAVRAVQTYMEQNQVKDIDYKIAA